MSYNLQIQMVTSSITISATEDIPHCDLTIIQIRRNYSPTHYGNINNPYIDASRPGVVVTEYDNYIQYVDPDSKQLYSIRTSEMILIHITSIQKGSYTYVCGLTSNTVIKNIKVDQTPTLVIQSSVIQVLTFVGSHQAKEDYVRTVCDYFFSQSKLVYDHNPFA